MPRLMIPLDATDDMVNRPVVFSIAEQLKQHTRLPSNMLVLFPGDAERVPTPGSTFDDKTEHAKFAHEAQMLVDVTERIEEDAVLTRAVLQPEHIPVFIDQLLGIVIKPVYAHTSLELSFTARFVDRNAARRWLNEMRNKISMSRDTILHKVTYSYTIPPQAIGLLEEIHRLRENQAGYGQDFNEYFNLAKSPHVTELTNVGGNVVRKGVRETQQRIIGQFDFKEEPEKGSKEGEADTWVINFTYNIRYDKPTAVVLEYPLVVHNQLIGEDFRPTREDAPVNHLTDKPQLYSTSLDYISKFEADMEYYRWKNHQKGIGLPDFDEFIPNSIITGTYRVVTWLIGLTEEDRRDLINFKDLPGCDNFDKDIHDWLLESEISFVTRPHKSVFQVQVYEEGDMLNYNLYKFDKDYNLKGTDNYNLRKTYHVRFGVYWDWSQLDQDAIDRLRERPDIVEKLIDELFPRYRDLYGDDAFNWDLISDTFISKKDMNELIDRISDREIWDIRSMKTVQTLFIHAENINNEKHVENLRNFSN